MSYVPTVNLGHLDPTQNSNGKEERKQEVDLIPLLFDDCYWVAKSRQVLGLESVIG